MQIFLLTKYLSHPKNKSSTILKTHYLVTLVPLCDKILCNVTIKKIMLWLYNILWCSVVSRDNLVL